MKGLLCMHPFKKTLNIIFSLCACNGNKQRTCFIETELVLLSKALESINCFMFRYIEKLPKNNYQNHAIPNNNLLQRVQQVSDIF